MGITLNGALLGARESDVESSSKNCGANFIERPLCKVMQLCLRNGIAFMLEAQL